MITLMPSCGILLLLAMYLSARLFVPASYASMLACMLANTIHVPYVKVACVFITCDLLNMEPGPVLLNKHDAIFDDVWRHT